MATTEIAPTPAAELTGEPVTISTTDDFRVGHGRFSLRNTGSQELAFALDGLWLDVNGQRQPLQLGSVHDVDRGQNLDPHDIQLAAGETLNVLIGFPPFVHIRNRASRPPWSCACAWTGAPARPARRCASSGGSRACHDENDGASRWQPWACAGPTTHWWTSCSREMLALEVRDWNRGAGP